MSAATATRPQAVKDDISVRHQELKEKLAAAEKSYAWWQEVLDHPEMKGVEAEFNEVMQKKRVALEDAKSEEVKSLQADIRSLKMWLHQFRVKGSSSSVVNARQELLRYEKDNGLLIPQSAAAAE